MLVVFIDHERSGAAHTLNHPESAYNTAVEGHQRRLSSLLIAGESRTPARTLVMSRTRYPANGRFESGVDGVCEIEDWRRTRYDGMSFLLAESRVVWPTLQRARFRSNMSGL